MTLPLIEGTETVFKNSQKGFELLLKGASLADFGVPIGQESKWLEEEQEKIQDNRLRSVRISETKQGVLISGEWKFPEGKLTLANPAMDYFDYKENNPSRYVIDFWIKNGPTLLKIGEMRKKEERIGQQKKSIEEARKRSDRRLAQEKIRNSEENLDKFCREPLNEKDDVFLPFLAAHDRIDLKKWFSVVKPDKDYKYPNPQEDTSEAKYVHLAVRLYREGQAALALRVLDFFNAEIPKSALREEMQFLRANALLRLGFQQQAREIFREIAANGKNELVSFLSGVYVASDAYEQGSALAAYEAFSGLIFRFSNHPQVWVLHVAAGEALFELKQIDQAAKEYQWSAMNAPDSNDRALAATRMGDLYLNKQDYESALASYFQASNLFKNEVKNFPNLKINRAETLYWLGQYERAEEVFKSFLVEHPSHSAGWRATFRLGEIQGRRTSQKDQQESRKWFYETVNRYPFSPGSTLARMRLIPCDDHGGFNSEGAIKFFKTETNEFNGRSEILLRRYKDYRALSYVRTLVSLGQNEAAVDVAMEELKNTIAQSEAYSFIGKILKIVFRKTILAMLDKGEHYKALKFYEDRTRANTKIKDILHQDPQADYLLKLSQVASDFGLGKRAKILTDIYHEANLNNKTERSPSANHEDERDLDYQLMKSEAAYSIAKSLWVSQGHLANNKIREELLHVVEESPFSYQKEIILSLLDEKAEKIHSALSHAQKAELLISKQKTNRVDSEKNVLRHWIALLQSKSGDPLLAVQIYKELSSRKENETSISTVAGSLGLPLIPRKENLLISEGDLLIRLEKWGEGADAYARALEEAISENSENLNHAKFEYSRSLLKMGDSKSKQLAFKNLKEIVEGSREDFWKRLAIEVLANAEKQRINRVIAKEGK